MLQTFVWQFIKTDLLMSLWFELHPCTGQLKEVITPEDSNLHCCVEGNKKKKISRCVFASTHLLPFHAGCSGSFSGKRGHE
jgi:hypothetical protein